MSFKRSIRDWWILVLAALIGAGVGWIIFHYRTPVYQAVGVLSVGIDFTRTGSLTDIEEDQVLGIAGDVLASPAVISSVLQKAEVEQIPLDEETFWKFASTDRRQNQWVLTIRHTDARTAAVLAELWTREGYAQLMTAIAHAENASHLQRYLDSLESCLQRATVFGPVSGYCDLENLEGLLEELSDTGKKAAEEKISSQGILPGTTVLLASLPEMPDQPIVFRRGELMLVGSLAGFLLGVLVLATGWTDRFYSHRLS
ncbi:MAG: hypothetical protein HPY59_12700 [Anaerolineae bacterium]|nr:hypothetical protein [Anaerolineae bacterium]